MRDQALDWHTAPPVNVLKFLVLGSEKDARSKLVEPGYMYMYDQLLNQLLGNGAMTMMSLLL